MILITSIQGRMHLDTVGGKPGGKLVAVCTVDLFLKGLVFPYCSSSGC